MAHDGSNGKRRRGDSAWVWRMSGMTRDGTAETNSRDQALRRERGRGTFRFPCLADHKHDWRPYPRGVAIPLLQRENMSAFPEHAASDPNRARVLVVGPMLSGKTTLVRSLCYGCGDDLSSRRQENRRRPPPTVGCNVDVKLLSGGRGYRSVEFWDVGGNPETALARRIFYEDSSAAGVLLVYDVSNRRSLRELRTWVAELASAGIRAAGDRSGTGVIPTTVPTARQATGQHGLRLIGVDLGDDDAGVEEEEDDLEGGTRAVGQVTPLFLVVANKRDVGDGFRRDGEAFAAELGAPHVTVSAREWGRESEEPFDRFFEAIFRHRAGCNDRGPPTQDEPVSSWSFPDDSNNHYVVATIVNVTAEGGGL